MGIKRERLFSPLPREVSLEDLVPQDSFYSRLEAAFWTSPSPQGLGAPPLSAGGSRPSVETRWSSSSYTARLVLRGVALGARADACGGRPDLRALVPGLRSPRAAARPL